MLCEKCKKRQATIYYTEIVGGKKYEKHLCEKCALEYADFVYEAEDGSDNALLEGLLSSILGSYYKSSQPVKKEGREAVIQCERCGMTYDAFLQGGKFGCAQCYSSFGKQLEKSFRQIHGATSHVGKRPKGFVSQTDRIIKDLSEVDRLSIRLQDAIEKEEFETAAALRDQIRALKAKEESQNV